MYHSPAVPPPAPPARGPNEEEEQRRARENIPPGQMPPLPAYQARSPPTPQYHASSASPSGGGQYHNASTSPAAQYHTTAGSPNGGHHQPPPYRSAYSSRPSSSAAMVPPPQLDQSPRLAPPLSPSNGHFPLSGSPYKASEARPIYYDPTSDAREREMAWSHGHYGSRPGMDEREAPYSDSKPREMAHIPPQHSSPSRYPPLVSPTRQTFHSHPPAPIEQTSPLPRPAANHSPRAQPGQTSISSLINGSGSASVANGHEERAPNPAPAPIVEETKSTRVDPMSFSSILSTPTVDKAPSTLAPTTSTPAPIPPPVREAPNTTNGDATPAASVKLEQPPTSTAKKARRSPAVKDDASQRESTPKPRSQKAASQSKKAAVAQAAVEDALRDIENISDAELGLERYTKSAQHYANWGQKRVLKVNGLEEISRKKRRTAAASRSAQKIDKRVQSQREEFRTLHERDILVEVQAQEIMDEKERKKDMQRKRRREKTIHQETEKLKLISEKIESTQDPRERERLIKDHHKSQKKVNTTKRILDHGSGVIEELDLPPPPLPAGGLPPLSEESPEPSKRRAKGMGTRLKKTKEQKQAEKDKAYNAAMEVEPVAIAPKEEKRKEPPVKEEGKSGKRRKVEKKEEETTPPPATTTYTSKGYLQIYDQIWKDIARKDVPKVYRIKETSLGTKQSNLRKTAQLASKEARRWQLKTNKSTKDTQARAKRCMKEMMSFWKRNEREERDLRRVAERQELDNARKAEAEREANRQKRKLNFLIQQTELYSHFIGKKVKTDEVERSTDSKDVGVSQETIRPGDASAKTIDLPSDDPKASKKVTNFEDLDFDNDDESQLKAAAMANAQHAVQEAQNKARAFNSGEDAMAELDDGELNFQNPTGLGETDIEQPKMLDCQLKEYQLKGLNWLVNLYEQGINGILADEMGLGKTVQSISVMAYLAETHNLWGPFLVIAPSSTLHNWQQEIARFVPSMKVLPYWGNARDRKILRKFWDRRNPTYKKSAPFHCLITSYQLVVQDTSYFQKMRWQYMILDEAQAIKSSQSSRWKSLLGFHCRNRLLLTGTPIQNNMQELWALLHFIMPSLFDSHDEFSDWFSRDIESHAQSNTKLNEDQLKRLHMILKPFMLRRVKKHVQKELGEKIEEDVYCDLTYRQRSYYTNLRNKISIMDLIEKAASGDDQDSATLMNLVMQFRKVCNHPDLFERADITSPLSMAYFAETASFVREGQNVNVGYSTRNLIEYDLPRLICSPEGRLDVVGPDNPRAGWRNQFLHHKLNIWTPENIRSSVEKNQAFSWLRFVEDSASDIYRASHADVFTRAVELSKRKSSLDRLPVIYDDSDSTFELPHSMLNIVQRTSRQPLADATFDGHLRSLMNISRQSYDETGLKGLEQCSRPRADAPPISVSCSNQGSQAETQRLMFNDGMRHALFDLSIKDERALLDARVSPSNIPPHSMLPTPNSSASRFTNIQVPSMRRFVTDSGKLAKLDQLLFKLKEDNHRVLLYFQMTRMIDLMEEYLTYRNYKYLRLDGSTKLEDRRDTVHDFQTRSDIFIFLLSTRAGGLGINLTSADTVIFYDSDWNPTIDSQAMDRAHRLGQTKQVTVYRMITRNTIEERIRKRALQKEEVQRVVISGGSGVDFNTRSKENKTKDIAMWLADDEQAEMIEQKSKELEEKANDPNAKKRGKKATAAAAAATGGRKKDLTMDDMYHEGEGNFDDNSAKPSADATPMDSDAASTIQKKGPRGGRGLSKKAKTAKQRLAIADGSGEAM